MESGNIVLSNNIDQSVKSSVRYTLVQKMMEENFKKWMTQQNTLNLINKLIEDCKKPNISLSTPSPIFVTRNNPLSQSQSGNYSFMPPVSPNSASLTNYNNDKRNMLTESQIKKKASDPSHNIATTETANTSKIPQFYFGPSYIPNETLELEDKLISQLFLKEELSLDEFMPVTTQLLEFPKMFNSVLFNKIQPEGTKISKKSFLKFHKENFQGKDEHRKFFNFITTSNNVLTRKDFIPFMKALLQFHPGLEFLKVHPEFQEKYTETVIMRIFYTCDTNDDGKITFRKFRKSNLLEVFRSVCEEPDINKIRDYFAYEHFYVLYCLFWDLDGNEHDFLIDKEEFSKKAVERIFAGVPRKFKSGHNDKMGFEDFVWYLLSEENKTTRTSIEYWFKILDLDSNGIITPHEMQFFYDEQIHRMQYLDNETVLFSDVLCQLYDNIKPEKEHQFTLKDFLKNKTYSSVFFNNLLNLNKFIAHEQKDPFARTEIDKNPDYSDWDKFAFYEYQRLTAEDNDEPQEANDANDNSHLNNQTDDLVASNNSGNE